MLPARSRAALAGQRVEGQGEPDPGPRAVDAHAGTVRRHLLQERVKVLPAQEIQKHLQAVGAVVHANTRAADVLARFGPDGATVDDTASSWK